MPEDKKTTTRVEPSSLSEAEAEAAAAKAEYEEAKADAAEAKPSDGTLRTTTISDAVAASEAAAKAEIAYDAAREKLKAARATSEAAWKADYEAAKAQVGYSDEKWVNQNFSYLIRMSQQGQYVHRRKRKRSQCVYKFQRIKPQNIIQNMYLVPNLVVVLTTNLDYKIYWIRLNRNLRDF
jgi:multidrug efflux pump subunit AcrA (membrane-fusion protein)